MLINITGVFLYKINSNMWIMVNYGFYSPTFTMVSRTIVLDQKHCIFRSNKKTSNLFYKDWISLDIATPLVQAREI